MPTAIKITSASTYKFVLIPLISLIVVVVLSAVVYNVGRDRIIKQTAQIDILESDVAVLGTKAAILLEEKDVLNLYNSPALAVLPNSVPSLLVMYKLKNLTFDSAVTLSALTVGTAAILDEGYTPIKVTFKINGPTSSVMSFLDRLQNQSPLTVIDKVEIKTDGTQSDAEVSALTYFSVLPESLPPITTPITRLTREELDLLNSFIVASDDTQFDLEPQPPSSVRNPFVF